MPWYFKNCILFSQIHKLTAFMKLNEKLFQWAKLHRANKIQNIRGLAACKGEMDGNVSNVCACSESMHEISFGGSTTSLPSQRNIRISSNDKCHINVRAQKMPVNFFIFVAEIKRVICDHFM